MRRRFSNIRRGLAGAAAAAVTNHIQRGARNSRQTTLLGVVTQRFNTLSADIDTQVGTHQRDLLPAVGDLCLLLFGWYIIAVDSEKILGKILYNLIIFGVDANI